MVARAGGYRYPLSPTILNVFVDAVIRHCVTVVALMEAGVEGLGILIHDLAAHVYADDGIVAATQLERLQRAFDILAELFDWFGLHKNTRKMVSMEFQLCHTPGSM